MRVVADFSGIIPSDEKQLRALPGIGAYTAAAIRAIAFDRCANVVDGNVERVVARLFAIEEALPAAKKIISDKAKTLLPEKRFSDYAQALMDLGASVCTPKKPSCDQCPLRQKCAALAGHKQESFPRITAKKKSKQQHAVMFVLRDSKGRYLLRRRPDKGLLASMWEFPSPDWNKGQDAAALFAKSFIKDMGIKAKSRVRLSWRAVDEVFVHVFTHIKLKVSLRISHSDATFLCEKDEYRFMSVAEMDHSSLPTLMRKVLHSAQMHDKKGAV
jgi:A/G-specific adenine glycosylase